MNEPVEAVEAERPLVIRLEVPRRGLRLGPVELVQSRLLQAMAQAIEGMADRVEK
jgi:hypothetical protein